MSLKRNRKKHKRGVILLIVVSLLTLMVTPCMLALPQAMRDTGATARFFRWLGRRFGAKPAHGGPAHPAPAE